MNSLYSLRSLQLLLLFFLTANSFGQSLSLSGTITDADGRTIPGAAAQVVGTTMGTASNTFGTYRLEGLPPGRHVLRFSSLGSATVQQELDLRSDRTFDVVLEQSSLELKEVTITSQRDPRSQTFSALDLRTRPVNTSQDLLQVVPGLFIAQHAGGGKAEQIFFRGFDVDHGTDLQVSVDGLPVNMVSHAHGQGYADLHFTIPETVDKLLVHKGPYDARFGDFATSGTVEFVTKDRLEQSEVKLETGMFNTLRAVGQFDLLGSKHLFSERDESAYVAGEYAYTDAYFNSPQGFARYNAFGKYVGQLGARTQLTLSASTFGANWDASGQIPERAVASGLIDRYGAIDDREGGNTQRSNAYATLVNGLGNGGSLKNQLYFVKYDFELFSNFTFFANDSVNGDMIAQTDARTIMGYTGSYTTRTHLGKFPLRLGTGVGLRYDQADIALKNAVDRATRDTIVAGAVDQINGNGYMDATLEVTERLAVNLSARLDLFRFNYADARGTASLSGTAVQQRVSPKLNFTYTASDRLQVYLRTGMGFHSNDARAVVVDRTSRTLPRAYGLDLGSTFKPAPRMLVNAALFGLYLENELVYVGDGGVVETNDPTLRMGIELNLRYQIRDKLFADLDINAVRATLVGAPAGADQVPLAPRFTTIGGLAYMQDRGWNASLRYRHIADRPANEANSVVAKGYFLVDAKASYRFTAFEVGASVENLFNVEWNQAQFDTESRLRNEDAPISELHFTPGTPFFLKGFVAYRF